MKRHKYFLLTLILITPQLVFSQFKLSLGPELGVSISGIPRIEKRTIPVRNDRVKETYLPVTGPVIGGWTKIGYGKHLFIGCGIQYTIVGEQYHYHRDGNDLPNHLKYKSDEWESQVFHKISIPFSIGYDFIIKGRKSTVFLGRNESRIIKGEYFRRRLFIKEKTPASNVNTVKQLNPFDKSQFTQTAKRRNTGIFLGIGTSISEKIELNVRCMSNQYVFYGNSFGGEGVYHDFFNGDVTLTMKFAIK